ncbi:predicted transcriptional regulator [Paenibacillus popilliae ATCC 14706]|uniref:Predicted transcriptional regulator n=1 Tax=Paenibacillus popilliae ATCC 14706 TaxID=1212764 RepID=M9M4N4_PAEPP|nr:predicted transcriptional regulator [Paenibacillus popilliae ATCC 14706]
MYPDAILIVTFVSTGNLELLRDSKRRLVEQKMQDMIQSAISLNISKDELHAMMDILYEED